MSAAAQAAITVTPAVSSAGMATITLNSTAAGTGSLVLLRSGSCGSAAQTQAGQDGSGAPAYRKGSLSLTAGADGHYTVRNLGHSQNYTVCATNGADTASATFSAPAMAAFGAPSWQVVGSAGFSEPGGANYQSLQFAPDGVPHVAYKDLTIASGNTTVRRFGASSWDLVGPARFSAVTSADYQSLAFAPDGTPYVAYTVDATSKITVRRFTGSTWSILGSAGFSAADAVYLSMAIAPDGTPYVAYSDAFNGGKATVMRFNGSAWVPVGGAGFSPGGAYYQSLAFAPDGAPHVAYKDASNGNKTTVMRFNGSAWAPVGSAGFSAGGTYFQSLAFAPDGAPYVAYVDVGNGYKTTVMRYDGSNWMAVGTPGFSADEVWYMSLAITPDGVPYVAYQDDGNGGKSTVMRFNGSSWEPVGGAGFSVGSASGLSLAIAPDGSPHVAYGDGGNGGRTTVLRLTGTAAAPTALTAVPGVGQVTVSFAPPASNGGSAITSYTVTSAPGGLSCTAVAPSTSCVVAGLNNGSSYTFAVVANNAAGASPASSSVTATTQAAAPGAPTGLIAVIGDGAVALTWTAPTSNGGSAITGYTVTGSPAGSCTTSGALTCTISGLTNGTVHSFSVTASNAAGAGNASAMATATPQVWSQPVLALPGGGSAGVQVGAPPGCTVSAATIVGTTMPAGAPAGSSFPLGVFSFDATGSGCGNASLSVRLDYPAGALSGLQPYKYGPAAPGAQPSWFPYGSVVGDSVIYSVTDNGVGDNDTQLGAIADPFAPVLFAAAQGAGDVTSIPTLSEWGMILLSLLAAMVGMWSQRRRGMV